MYHDLGLFILRVSVGLTMLFAHGWPKLMDFTAKAAVFPDPLGLGSSISLTLAVTSEFFCSIALILGILTRWVSVPLLITMLVAAFIVKAGQPFKKQELALMYAFIYTALICMGGGKFSIDGIFRKNA